MKKGNIKCIGKETNKRKIQREKFKSSLSVCLIQALYETGGNEREKERIQTTDKTGQTR